MPKPLFRGVTWRQPLVFIVATFVCTVLAIYAVVAAPVDSAAGAATGVSGLYFAAAVYVPLALWFGIWGCLAGYVSCLFMGLYLNSLGVPGYTLGFILVWSLADFFEGSGAASDLSVPKNQAYLEVEAPKTNLRIKRVALGCFSLFSVFPCLFLLDGFHSNLRLKHHNSACSGSS